ncbi:MAG: DegV family protein [Caldisericia bacterium]|nr:DegV family protein [Caldisericia bacterium]MDD4614518.1 DegV family protein [Caldisericia bacterium]
MAKKIIIITDSCCNFTEQEQQQMGVSSIASRIRVGNKVFRETDATERMKIAQMIHQGNVTPVLLHPSSEEVFQVYSLLYSEFDNVLSIHLSSHLSPNYSEAKKAQLLLYDTHIEVVDSLLAEPSLQMVIQYVSHMVSKKETFQTILTELPSIKKYFQSFLITHQLKFMRTNIDSSYITGLSLFKKNPYHLFSFENGTPHFIAKTSFNELEVRFIESISPHLINETTQITILYSLDMEKAKVLEKVIQGKLKVASITLRPMSLSSIARYGTESLLVGLSSLPNTPFSWSEQIDE